MGEYRGTEVIDTVDVDGSLRTLALVGFARSATVVGFVHEGGGIFVDTMARRCLPEIGLAPAGGTEFFSFHPQTRRTTHLRFEDQGAERSLVIEGTVPRRAVRVAP
jgi:hypothetical protein